MDNLAPNYSAGQDPTVEKVKIKFCVELVKRDFDKEFEAYGYYSFIQVLIDNNTITTSQADLLQLIYHTVDRRESYCFISQGNMAKILGYARATVNRNLKDLEKLNLVQVHGTHVYTSRFNFVPKETNCYTTVWNKPLDPATQNFCERGTHHPPPRANKTAVIPWKLQKESLNSPLPNGREENTPPNRKTDSDSTNFASRNKSSQFQFQNTTIPENFPQKNDKDHRYSNINKNLISGTPHTNKCLEKQKMGFFADLEVTKKNSRFTEFDYTSAKRLRKAIIDGQFVFSKSLGSLDSWANEFYQLRKCTTETEINIVLNWYISKIGQKYTPHAFSAVSFRKKFLSIKLMMKHQAEDEVSDDRSLNTFEQEFYDSTKLWDWKNKKLNKKDIKTAIITNADNYKKLSRAMLQTYQDLYGTSQLHDYYLDLMRSSLNSPEEFSKQQVTEVFHTLDNWDKWSGNILKTCFNCNNTESVEKLIMNLVKSASSGVADKSLLAIISSVKVKLSGG